VEVQAEGEEAELLEEAPLEEPPAAEGGPEAPQAETERLAPAPHPTGDPEAAERQGAAGEEIEKIETPEFLEEEPGALEGAPQALPEESPALLEEIAQVHQDTASLSLIAAPPPGGPPAASAPYALPPRPGEPPDLPEASDLTMETPSALLDETFSNFIALLFPDLSAEHLAAVRAVSKALQLQPGQVVVREGEEGDSLFILTRGRLEARGTFEGREITLGTFSPGDILGEVAFLNKVPRTATVQALEPSVVIELQGELTRKHLAPYPGLLNQLEVILQERVLKTLALLKKAEKRPDGNP
jgi:CRP-like cAMP-binding protein